MKKLTAIFLFIIITTFAKNVVYAVEYTDEQIRTEIEKQVIQQNKKYTDAEVKVIIASMPFKKMYISDGNIKFVVKSNFDKFVPRDIKKIYIYSNGKLEKQIIVSVRTLAYKEVLCANRQIDRDEILSLNNLMPKRMEVSSNIDYVLTKNMLDSKEMISRKWFREGEIIDRRFVGMKPDVKSYSTVKAFFKSGNIFISTDGVVLSDGMIGDYVDVRNNTYKKTYRGKVIGENKVLINM